MSIEEAAIANRLILLLNYEFAMHTLEGREQDPGDVAGWSAGMSPLVLFPTAIQQFDGVFAMVTTHSTELIENNAFGCPCCAAVPQANGLQVGLSFIFTHITVSSR
jgi:hypothetical protein